MVLSVWLIFNRICAVELNAIPLFAVWRTRTAYVHLSYPENKPVYVLKLFQFYFSYYTHSRKFYFLYILLVFTSKFFVQRTCTFLKALSLII